jgi:dsDNA-binding SOS-regulon protein
LDIVICFNIKNFVGKKIFHAPFSDHAFVATMFNFKKIHLPKIEFESRVLNPKNILSAKESLGKILPTFEIEHDNVSNHWQALKDVILSVVDRVAPLKKFKQKSEVDLPYFDKELVRLASIRDKSYKQAIVEKDPMKRKELYAYFQSDRNTFQSAIKKKKYEYYNKKIEEESLSSKKLWQTTK